MFGGEATQGTLPAITRDSVLDKGGNTWKDSVGHPGQSA